MTSKLTLSIEKEIIEKAKRFAKRSNRSLSDIVESYLKKITDDHLDEIDHELSKAVGVISLPKDFEEKKAIREILKNKYL